MDDKIKYIEEIKTIMDNHLRDGCDGIDCCSCPISDTSTNVKAMLCNMLDRLGDIA